MGEYFLPVLEAFQAVLSVRLNVFGILLEKTILGFLWFVHNLQFWLTIFIDTLERKLHKPSTTNSDSYSKDPFHLVKRGFSLLLYLSCLGFVRFCFRFTQLTYLAVLSVYIYLGFKEPVPLAVLNGLDKRDD